MSLTFFAGLGNASSHPFAENLALEFSLMRCSALCGLCGARDYAQ